MDKVEIKKGTILRQNGQSEDQNGQNWDRNK